MFAALRGRYPTRPAAALRRLAWPMLLMPVLLVGCGEPGGTGDAPNTVEEVKALIRGIGAGHATIQAEFAEWEDPDLASKAFEEASKRAAAAGIGGPRGFLAVGTPSAYHPETPAGTIAFQAPERWRIERTGGFTDVVVVVGERRWTQQNGIAIVDTRSPGAGKAGSPRGNDYTQDRDVEQLVQPAALVGGLDLSFIGHEQLDGRDMVVVEGRPSSTDFSLAESIRLWVDVETGVVVQQEAIFEGAPFSRTTLRNIVLDKPFPPKTFPYVPPDGVSLHTAQEAETRNATPQEAARLVPFTVLLPAGHDELTVSPGYGGADASVEIRRNSTPSLVLSERKATGDVAREGGHVVRRGGVEMHTFPGDESTEPEVLFERDGTHVQMYGDMPLEALIEVAAGLRGVPNP